MRKIVGTLIVIALVAVAAWLWWNSLKPARAAELRARSQAFFDGILNRIHGWRCCSTEVLP